MVPFARSFHGVLCGFHASFQINSFRRLALPKDLHIEKDSREKKHPGHSIFLGEKTQGVCCREFL